MTDFEISELLELEHIKLFKCMVDNGSGEDGEGGCYTFAHLKLEIRTNDDPWLV